MNDIIKRLENTALSNYDILLLLDNKVNIVLYPDLYKYTSIDQLLNPYNCAIILYESRKHYGHWCSIIKRDNSIEFFNPYGGLPDDCLNHINLDFRIESNQVIPILKLLMHESPYELHYNEFQFQQKGYDIKTCGRHCVVRCMLKKYDIYK